MFLRQFRCDRTTAFSNQTREHRSSAHAYGRTHASTYTQAANAAVEDAAVDSLSGSTHRRGLLQGLLGTAALTTLPTPASNAEAATTTIQAPAAPQQGPSTSNRPCCPADASGYSSDVAAADAAAADAGSSAGCCCQPSSTAAAAAVRDPAINRGCATAGGARQQLAGLIPPRQVDLSLEVLRAQAALQQCGTDLEKHRLLMSLKETNRAAFLALLQQDLEGLLPLVYTPVIAQACLNWGTLIPRPLGLYVTPEDDPVDIIKRWPSQEVRVAVITDGERILGLGDLGAHGMGIPTGKCNVYAAAGTPPDWLLPITIDVGTENSSLRSDPLYVGQPRSRLRGQRYFDVVEGVVGALQQRYGNRVIVHWEDLAIGNALQMLQRTEALGLPTFNDDIQCTAAVALAALLGATAVPGVLPLQDQTFCFLGAGQANLGVAQLLVQALMQRGLSAADAKARLWMVDSQGLTTTDRPQLTPQKAQFAQDPSRLKGRLPSYSSSSSSSSRRRKSREEVVAELAGVVGAVQPTALIGAAGVAGSFGQPVLAALVKSAQAVGGPTCRPLVFALSNPTEQAEVTFQEALKWTDGAAVYASGSPFAAVTTPAGMTLRPAQANNCFVFPGLAHGILEGGIWHVDDRLLLVAAEALAGMLTQQEIQEECVLPRISRLPEVTRVVAAAVSRAA